MFDQPKSTTYTAPPGTLDVNERYIFKLIKLTDKGVSRFADPAKGETFHEIEWQFQIAHQDTRAQLFDADGNPWVFIDTTTSKTGKNPKNGMVAKARQWIEAFMGHSVEQDEITAATPEQLINRFASGLFEFVDRESQDGTQYQRLQIMRLSPYKAAVNGASAAPPPPPPPPKPAQDDIPF